MDDENEAEMIESATRLEADNRGPEGADNAKPNGWLKRWLDRWCAPRWRALVVWVGLSALMTQLLLFGLGTWIDEGIESVVRKWVAVAPLPTGVSTMWFSSAEGVIVIWFQPILLRLNLLRGVTWIASFTLAVAIQQLSIPDPAAFLPSFTILFIAASVPGLTLIEWRTRPAMVLPAAALFAGVLLWGRQVTEYEALLFAAANLPYAAILLYGTHPVEDGGKRSSIETTSTGAGDMC